MITESGISLASVAPQKLDSLLTPKINKRPWLSNHGSGSGGFAENVFIAASKELFGRTVLTPLQFKVIKNSDFQVI